MPLQTIVALTDFSALAERALERGALLAAEHRARLLIVYAAERHDPMFADPQSRLEQRARQLARRHDVPVQALPACGSDVFGAVMRAAARADLLVLDKRAPAGLVGWLGLGLLARIVRASPCPVLLVQRPAQQAYRHVLAALHQGAAPQRWLQHAAALQPQAVLELFHAVASPDPAAHHKVHQAAHQALQPLAQHRRAVLVSDVFQARRNRVAAVLGVGGKARRLAVQQERSNADLVVWAPGGAGVLGALAALGKARRVLRKVRCDVLLYPLAQRPAWVPGAQSAVARRWTAAT